MLSLDVYKGQLNNTVLAKFKRMNCTCSFIPSGTTGFIQVCDVAINKPLKDRIAELAKIHYDTYEDQWIKNKYIVSDWRVMLTQWVRQAQDDLHRYNSEFIKQAFRDVGLSLPTDGSQDNQIKIKDLLGIQVGNWQDWAPTKGVVQLLNEESIIQTSDDQLSTSWIDTVMSNRTLQEVEDQSLDQNEGDEVDGAVEDECI